MKKFLTLHFISGNHTLIPVLQEAIRTLITMDSRILSSNNSQLPGLYLETFLFVSLLSFLLLFSSKLKLVVLWGVPWLLLSEPVSQHLGCEKQVCVRKI